MDQRGFRTARRDHRRHRGGARDHRRGNLSQPQAQDGRGPEPGRGNARKGGGRPAGRAGTRSQGGAGGSRREGRRSRGRTAAHAGAGHAAGGGNRPCRAEEQLRRADDVDPDVVTTERSDANRRPRRADPQHGGPHDAGSTRTPRHTRHPAPRGTAPGPGRPRATGRRLAAVGRPTRQAPGTPPGSARTPQRSGATPRARTANGRAISDALERRRPLAR